MKKYRTTPNRRLIASGINNQQVIPTQKDPIALASELSTHRSESHGLVLSVNANVLGDGYAKMIIIFQWLFSSKSLWNVIIKFHQNFVAKVVGTSTVVARAAPSLRRSSDVRCLPDDMRYVFLSRHNETNVWNFHRLDYAYIFEKGAPWSIRREEDECAAAVRRFGGQVVPCEVNNAWDYLRGPFL